jgi:hypothetical protein
MKRQSSNSHRRGRPEKFGRPAELVQVTLPTDVVRGLSKIDDDLARAIVQLFERAPAWALESTLDFELVSIADRHFLIIINAAVIRHLPGVDIIPLEGNRAFLALAPGRGVSDLELAVIDRLGETAQVIPARERLALDQLRLQLRTWREDPALRFHGRAIIVVEANAPKRVTDAARHQGGNGGNGHPGNGQPDVELVCFTDERCLIVVNSTVIRDLPGVDIVPMGRSRAFLALAPGSTVSDLELAILDRMNLTTEDRERQVLEHLRGQLKAWRHDAALEFRARAIVVVESMAVARTEGYSPTPPKDTDNPDTRRHTRADRRSWPKPSQSGRSAAQNAARPAQAGQRLEASDLSVH